MQNIQYLQYILNNEEKSFELGPTRICMFVPDTITRFGMIWVDNKINKSIIMSVGSGVLVCWDVAKTRMSAPAC